MTRFITVLLCLTTLSGFGQIDAETQRQFEIWMNTKDDWANLAYYQKENCELPQPSKNEHRVVFMGNSITEGWTGHSPEFFHGKPYINRGIGGQTTPQMLIRFKQDVVNLQPEIVVILAGTNDLAGNTGTSTNQMIIDNISSMAEIAKANGIKVILSSILPVYDYPWRPGLFPSQRIIEINEWMQSYCKANDHIYLDYFSAMVDERNGLPKKYANDGVHPTKEGYSVMEQLVEQAIAKAQEK